MTVSNINFSGLITVFMKKKDQTEPPNEKLIIDLKPSIRLHKTNNLTRFQ